MEPGDAQRKPHAGRNQETRGDVLCSNGDAGSLGQAFMCGMTISHKEVPMKHFIKPRSLALLLPLLIIAGCSHTIPTTDRMPQPPAQLGKTPPTIAPPSASGKQVQAPESILPVTLSTDLTPVQRAIQTSVPERFSDVDQPFTNPLANDYHWQFIREGPPEVSIQDGLVQYQAVYRGEIESRA